MRTKYVGLPMHSPDHAASKHVSYVGKGAEFINSKQTNSLTHKQVLYRFGVGSRAPTTRSRG